MGDAASHFDGDLGLLNAEAQMSEHESDLFLELIEKTSACIPGDTKLFEVPVVILGLLEEDPDLRDAFERLTILKYFAGPESKGFLLP